MNTRTFLIKLCICLTPGLALGGFRCISLFESNASLQQQQERQLSVNEFNIDRGLDEVSQVLSYFKDGRTRSFLDDVLELADGDHFLDSGAGKGYVIADIFKSKNRGYAKAFGAHFPITSGAVFATALAYKQPAEWDSEIVPELAGYGVKDQARYLKDRFVEDITNAELTQFGQLKLILDSVGPMAYSDRPDLILQKYLDILRDDGGINMYFGKMEHRTSDEAQLRVASDNFISEVIQENGQRVTLIDWMSSIPGLKVYPSKSMPWAVRIEKTEKTIVVPKLEVVVYEEGRPPFRIFRVIND